jgi:branched-chain amino acid transport system substrate-binding protein
MARTNCEYIEWASKETGLYPKKAVVMCNQGWERLAQEYEKWAKAKGVYHETFMYPWTQDDFTVILSKWKHEGVDLLLRISYPRDATKLVQNMKTIDYNVICSMGTVGGDASPEYAEILGKDGDYVSVGENYPHDINLLPWVKDINARFKKKYGYDLEHSSGQALCSVSALIDSLERAGSTDRDKIRDALAKTDIKFGQLWCVMPDGVKFDAEGQNTLAQMPVSQWYNATKHIIYPKKYATMTPVWPMVKWSDRK